MEDKIAGLPKDILLGALGFFIGQQSEQKKIYAKKKLYDQTFIMCTGTVLVGKSGGEVAKRSPYSL